MEPVRVVEQDPKECDMWRYNEIVFIDDLHPESVPFGILREDWDVAMEANDDLVYKALEEFGYSDVYVLVSPEYWEHYKTQANWQYNYNESPMYLPDIVEAWENGNTEKIVRDASSDCGYMYDLEGNPVPRLIYDDLYDDRYNLIDCISYIQKNEGLFGPFELEDARYWTDASQMLRVTYKPLKDLGELLEAWLKCVDEGTFEIDSIGDEYTKKYFEQFRKENE